MPQDASEVYARLLLPKRHGYPLWAPEPYSNLPEGYRVSIGDVGTIITNAGFDPLFNICASADNTVNSEGVPLQFKRIVLRHNDISILDSYHDAGADISSASIKKATISINSPLTATTMAPVDLANFRFSCARSEGAILLLPDGACRTDLRNKKDVFRQHAIDNAIRWYQFANDDQGREIPNGSLVLVTGCDMAQSWGIASFSGAPVDNGAELNFTASHVVEGMATLAYSWQTNCSATVRTGPKRDNLRPIQTFSQQGIDEVQTLRSQEIHNIPLPPISGAFANSHRVDSRGSMLNEVGRDQIYNITYQVGEQRTDALQVPFRHPSAMHETHGTVESAQQNSISGMREATTVPAQPRANHKPNQNQCVFVRGFRISLREGALAVLKKSPKTSMVANARPKHFIGSYIPFTKAANAGRSWFGDSSDGSGASFGRTRQCRVSPNLSSEVQQETVVPAAFVDEFPGVSKPYHPSMVINEFLLDAFPQAQVAITHDDDWIAVIHEDETAIPAREDLLKRIQQRYLPKVESAAVFLERNGSFSSVKGVQKSPPKGIGRILNRKLEANSVALDPRESRAAEPDNVAIVEVGELSQDDVIIVLMGPTGTGKSSFINMVTGRDSGVGHDLESCTTKIGMVKVHDIILVDTPGFDDTHMTDIEVLCLIADWLTETYKRDIKLAGILYFHRISDNRVAGTPLRNLQMFERLCGRNYFENIILTTTMWDKVGEDIGSHREKELKGEFWKTMINQGSKTIRYRNTHESAWEILDSVVGHKRHTVLLQREMVDMKRQLLETEAGQTLYNELELLFKRQLNKLDDIRLETTRQGADPSVLKHLQEYEDLRKGLQTKIAQMQTLEVNVGNRFFRYFTSSSPLSHRL